MTPDQFLWLSLVAKVGIPAAISILDGIKNAKTVDEAITALQKAQGITAEDYKREHQS